MIDVAIGKAKPFWYGQAFNNDRLAVMVSKRQQADYLTASAGEYFDWLLRHETELQDVMIRATDAMLVRGRGVVKATVDAMDENRLKFEAIDPLFILTSPGADDFEDADWFAQVKHYTRAQFERDPRFDNAPGTWDKICGGEENLEQYWQNKATREGITHTAEKTRAVVWEIWEREGDDWRVTVASPQMTNAPLRPSFLCPYKKDGKPSLPFFSFPLEIKDAGWYSPRGLAEKVAPFEMLGCKIVNEWLDSLSFTSKQVFTAEGAVPNGAAIRFAHGELLPGNIRRVDMGQASTELPQMVNFVQTIGEQVAQMPDFGVGQNQPNDKRTATEVNRIGQVMDVGTSFNGEIFRRRLGRLYEHAWALLLQYQPEEMTYLLGDEAKQMPAEALHDAYSIRVGGRADQWNQQQTFQRAVARLQLLGGDPNASHEELVKAVLAADDPQAAKVAFVPSNQRAATESEDEAQEITILQDGFPALVQPNEDHAARLHVLLGWLAKQQQTGAPINPLAQQRVQEHLTVHFQYLKKQNPQAAEQVLAAVRQMEAGAQQQQMPQAISPMPAEVAQLPTTTPTMEQQPTGTLQ